MLPASTDSQRRIPAQASGGRLHTTTHILTHTHTHTHTHTFWPAGSSPPEQPVIADPAETVWTTLDLLTGKAGLRLARKPQEAGRRRVEDYHYWWVGGGCNDNTTLSFLHGRRDRERGTVKCH